MTAVQELVAAHLHIEGLEKDIAELKRQLAEQIKPVSALTEDEARVRLAEEKKKGETLKADIAKKAEEARSCREQAGSIRAETAEIKGEITPLKSGVHGKAVSSAMDMSRMAMPASARNRGVDPARFAETERGYRNIAPAKTGERAAYRKTHAHVLGLPVEA